MESKAIKREIEVFCNSVNAEKLTEFVTEYAKIGDSELYGGKHGGSDAEHRGAEYIAEKLREIGVPKVEFIKTHASRYQFNDASLEILSETGDCGTMEIRPYGYRSPGTGEEGITAELIDGCKSTKAELDKSDVAGKIVLIEGMGSLEAYNLSGQIEEAQKRGSVALLIYMTEEILNEDTIRVQTPLNELTIPVVGISFRHAKYLKSLLNRIQKNEQNNSVTVNLKVDADYTPDSGFTQNIVAEIPGSVSEEKIIFSAHLDHFFRCLQDNIASCATLLGIAEAVIKSGYKPRRCMLFAFHGSHECGMINSKYPYITGSYHTVLDKKDEWVGKAVANINLEYAALPLDELKAGSSLGNDENLTEYLHYAPELTGGFKKKKPAIPIENYAIFTWCDGISYCSNGIPSYTNDIMSEQLEGKSVYIGRDHSNHDNWEIFSTDALRDSIRYYGGFGIYIDMQPYVQIDFDRQVKRMEAESEFDELEKEGIKTQKYRDALGRLNEISGKLSDITRRRNKIFLKKNDEYLNRLERASWDEGALEYMQSHDINRDILEIFDFFQSRLDKVAASDFLITASGKYLYNISLLEEASVLLEQRKADEAARKLFEVDLASMSYYFSEDIVNKIRSETIDKICEDRRTWARGRELKCMTLYKLMRSLRENENADNYSKEIRMIKRVIRRESFNFIRELKKEFVILEEGRERIGELCRKLSY